MYKEAFDRMEVGITRLFVIGAIVCFTLGGIVGYLIK